VLFLGALASGILAILFLCGGPITLLGWGLIAIAIGAMLNVGDKDD
jgi:hypothetical protein